jgi:hypothetical protein
VLNLQMQPSDVSITGPLNLPVMKAKSSRLLGSDSLANSENP